jgi:hypothetical protein
MVSGPAPYVVDEVVATPFVRFIGAVFVIVPAEFVTVKVTLPVGVGPPAITEATVAVSVTVVVPYVPVVGEAVTVTVVPAFTIVSVGDPVAVTV